MTFPTLAKLIRDSVSHPSVTQVDFVWHGGEVTLLPRSYVEKALWLQQHFRHPGVRISNCIQTNATRLDEDWVRLFRDYDISVGVSIDGPAEVHDSRRLTVSGQGTWKQVNHGIELLRSGGVPFGGLVVVDDAILRFGPQALLELLVHLGIRGAALLNAVPPNQQSVALRPTHLPYASYADFLRGLFAAWWPRYRDVIEIRELQSLVEAVRVGYTALCVFRENCMGTYLTIEPSGTVSACEKYVGDPAFVYGTLQDAALGDLVRRSRALAEVRGAVQAEKEAMAGCPDYAVCRGACPHDARLRRQSGQWDAGCCGLRPLIHDIRQAVSPVTITTS